MSNALQDYVSAAGLTGAYGSDAGFAEKLESILKEDVSSRTPTLKYIVPKMTPDGSCSIVDEPDDIPYDLGALLRTNGFEAAKAGEFVSKIDAIAGFLHADLHSDWTGIYKKMEAPAGPALVKIAYRGRISRAEFPITEAFAAHSNNSTVGITGKAVLVGSVRQHLDEGKPYYECDGAVQSEICLPIFGSNGDVIGIIDIESFQENFFTPDRIAKAAIVAVALAHILAV